MFLSECTLGDWVVLTWKYIQLTRWRCTTSLPVSRQTPPFSFVRPKHEPDTQTEAPRTEDKLSGQQHETSLSLPFLYVCLIKETVAMVGRVCPWYAWLLLLFLVRDCQTGFFLLMVATHWLLLWTAVAFFSAPLPFDTIINKKVLLTTLQYLNDKKNYIKSFKIMKRTKTLPPFWNATSFSISLLYQLHQIATGVNQVNIVEHRVLPDAQIRHWASF